MEARCAVSVHGLLGCAIRQAESVGFLQPPTLGRAICFTQRPLASVLISSKNTFTQIDIHNDQFAGTMAQSSGHTEPIPTKPAPEPPAGRPLTCHAKHLD